MTTLFALQGISCDDASESESEEMSWEEFKANSLVDPAVPGLYLIEGDLRTSDESKLRSFYERTIRPRSWVEGAYYDLANDRMGILDPETRMNLSYCISNSGANGWTDATQHAQIVQHMHDAEVRWERAADVNFIYDSSKDGNCVDGTSGVYFAIRRVDVLNGCGNAFFPDDAAGDRTIWIKHKTPPEIGCDNFTRTFSHELGHVLGLMHEDYRVECNNTNQDATDVYLSEYDNGSVMHYPVCNVGGGVSVPSRRDVSGVRVAYTTPKDNWRHGSTRQSSDFNADGKKDIYWYRTEPRVSPPMPPTDVILYGAAAPTFTNSLNSPTSNLLRPVTGDYNNDGRSDIFFYEQGTFGTTERALFKQAGNLNAFNVNTSITADGFHQQLSGYFLTQNETNPTPDINFYGPGAGVDRQLSAAPSLSAGFQWVTTVACANWNIGDATNYYTPIVGDFNANSATDLLFYNSDDAANSKYFSNSGTGFNCQTPTTIDLSALLPGLTTTYKFYAHVTGRFDSGSSDDILSYSPTLSTVFQFGGASGPGTTTSSVSEPLAGAVFRPFAGDFDGDGDDDIYWFNTAVGGTDRIWWMTGTGSGHTETTISGTAMPGSHHDHVPIAGDYTGEGRVDILWWFPLDGSLSLWSGNANQTFSVSNLTDTVHGFPVGYGLH